MIESYNHKGHSPYNWWGTFNFVIANCYSYTIYYCLIQWQYYGTAYMNTIFHTVMKKEIIHIQVVLHKLESCIHIHLFIIPGTCEGL